MTREEMEELADFIVEKLINKQKEYDEEFIEELKTSDMVVDVHEKFSPEDKILVEIALTTLDMNNFLEKEEYDKADLCHKKIMNLRNKLKDKLNG
jgi:hypothetical protein